MADAAPRVPVLDASVAVRWVVAEAGSDEAARGRGVTVLRVPHG